jgi:hypothetical protein
MQKFEKIPLCTPLNKISVKLHSLYKIDRKGGGYIYEGVKAAGTLVSASL